MTAQVRNLFEQGAARMLRNEHHADDRAMMLDFCGIMNAELRELTATGVR